jgi:PAS domain-containing protein
MLNIEELEAHGRIMDMATDGCWFWDLRNPEFEYMSPRFWSTLGYDYLDMPHSPDAWKTIINEGDREKATVAFAAHLNDGAPYHLLVRFRHALGHWVWIVCRGQASYDEKGEPFMMFGSHTDVTQLIYQQVTDSEHSADGSKIMDQMNGILMNLGMLGENLVKGAI